MKQDYLNQVLPPSRPPITAAALPSGEQIREAEGAASAIHGSLDMLRFTDEERGKVGPASSPDDLEEDRLFTELTDEFPFLLTLIGRKEDAMRSGYDMERALLVYDEANRSLVQVAGGVLVICGAELTEQNDRIEEAARALAADHGLDPARRASIGNAENFVLGMRKSRQDALTTRVRRKARREARHETKQQ